jgi:hypothetical protein
MKLTLTWTVSGATNGTFTLIDSPDPIPYSNFQINDTRLIQEAQFFRGFARRNYDRGNLKTEISFDTTQKFNSQAQAEEYILMHGTSFPVLNSGAGFGPFLVTIVAGVVGGGSTLTRFLKNAALETTHRSLMGCTGKFSYRITGGAMTKTAN